MDKRTKIGAATRIKWPLFRLLEWASELRSAGDTVKGNPAASVAAPDGGGRSESPDGPPPLWVYVSTIGELNAIDPFLRRLLDEMGAPPLVLLTDHVHYRDSFVARYPQARVCGIDHRSTAAMALVAESAPRLLVLAEIPCLLSDAPCRIPFALAYALKRRGIPVCAINGWLYRGEPSCTMDAIEKRLFGRDYVRLLDIATVQDDATREALVAAGADSRRVFVTGNIKFDAAGPSIWSPAGSRSPNLLQDVASSGRPTVTAGCVTNISEQILVLNAFATVQRSIADVMLILAPRHPEVKERMAALRKLLTERGLAYVFRSEAGDVPVPRDVNCLVLDTMGELKDFYAAGTISYVGLNHNVLEPLSYNKPVVVTPGWDPIYPSFPVYKRLLEQKAITQVDDAALGEAWLALLRDPLTYSARTEEIGRLLQSLKGATARNLELLGKFGLLFPPDKGAGGIRSLA